MQKNEGFFIIKLPRSSFVASKCLMKFFTAFFSFKPINLFDLHEIYGKHFKKSKSDFDAKLQVQIKCSFLISNLSVKRKQIFE